MREPLFVPFLVLLCLGLTGCSGVYMSDYDRGQYELNRDWIAQRAAPSASSLATSPSPAAVVVYADAGVWHLGATSIVEALESSGVPCRVIDRTSLTPGGLRDVRVLIVPGGWAPLERDVNTPASWEEIRRFVREGGRYIGVCAGAYLASTSVLWLDESYTYPLGLFDGVADGPVKGLSPYPTACGVRLTVTDAGRARGLGPLAEADVYYNGGCCFRHLTYATILASFPDGTPAIIALRYGRGGSSADWRAYRTPRPGEWKREFAAADSGADGLPGTHTAIILARFASRFKEARPSHYR